jgi:hypothetical protein
MLEDIMQREVAKKEFLKLVQNSNTQEENTYSEVQQDMIQYGAHVYNKLINSPKKLRQNLEKQLHAVTERFVTMRMYQKEREMLKNEIKYNTKGTSYQLSRLTHQLKEHTRRNYDDR